MHQNGAHSNAAHPQTIWSGHENVINLTGQKIYFMVSGPLLLLTIQGRLTLRPGLEARLRPKILTRTFEDFALHKLVNPQRILVFISGRKIFK